MSEGFIISPMPPFKFKIGEQLIKKDGEIGEVIRRHHCSDGRKFYVMLFDSPKGGAGSVFESELERVWSVS